MLWIIVGVILVFAVIRGVVGYLQKYESAAVGLLIVCDIRNSISSHLLRLSPSFFARHPTGTLISRMTNDTLLIRTALTEAVAALLRDTIRVVALLIAAFFLDPVLAAISFIGFPLCLFPVMKFGKKVRKLSRVGQDQFGGLTALLQEGIVGHKVVQSFAMEDAEQGRFEAENANLTKTYCRAEKFGALSGPTNEVIASLAIASIILYGGFSVIGGVRTQGDFIAFITSLFLLYDPLKRTTRVNTVIQMGIAGADRIFEILDTKSDIEEIPAALELEAAHPRIEYRDVWFRYGRGMEKRTAESTEPLESEASSAAQAETEPWALRGVSLVVDPGETLALVGMSGGGKSTMVNLLPRFYDPQQGGIYINGVDLKHLSLSSLRRAIAVVDQHTFLFNDTVFHNIAYGRFDADEKAVIDAAKSANAHDFIMRLPQGYQTMIGELGFRLSGGERARIAIARALLKDAPILVLDEATAALDSESEQLVQQAIDRAMAGRTVVVIAHRLATVRKANRIAVMNLGQIVELGTHDELLSRGGEYSKLYRLQFRESDRSTLREVTKG